VAVCDFDAQKGEKAVKDLQAEHGSGRVIFIKTDVTNVSELEGNAKLHSLNKGAAELTDTGKAYTPINLYRNYLSN
jgi:hypothetical protein